ELDQFYLPKGQDLRKAQSRRYAIHYQVYERADAQMKETATAAAPTFSTIKAELEKLDSDMRAAMINDVQALPSVFAIDKEPISNACNTAVAVAEIAARQKRFALLKLTLSNAPANAVQVAQQVAA